MNNLFESPKVDNVSIYLSVSILAVHKSSKKIVYQMIFCQF